MQGQQREQAELGTGVHDSSHPLLLQCSADLTGPEVEAEPKFNSGIQDCRLCCDCWPRSPGAGGLKGQLRASDPLLLLFCKE